MTRLLSSCGPDRSCIVQTCPSKRTSHLARGRVSCGCRTRARVSRSSCTRSETHLTRLGTRADQPALFLPYSRTGHSANYAPDAVLEVQRISPDADKQRCWFIDQEVASGALQTRRKFGHRCSPSLLGHRRLHRHVHPFRSRLFRHFLSLDSSATLPDVCGPVGRRLAEGLRAPRRSFVEGRNCRRVRRGLEPAWADAGSPGTVPLCVRAAACVPSSPLPRPKYRRVAY